MGSVVIEEGVDESTEVGEEGRVIGQAYYKLVDENFWAL